MAWRTGARLTPSASARCRSRGTSRASRSSTVAVTRRTLQSYNLLSLGQSRPDSSAPRLPEARLRALGVVLGELPAATLVVETHHEAVVEDLADGAAG